MITLYAFGNGPDGFVGFTRDLRIEWALEEMGLPYRVEAVDYNAGALKAESFTKINSFHQLPAISDDGYALSESGAILFYLAEKSGRFMPKDFQAKYQVIRWSLAVLNTLETTLAPLEMAYMQKESDPEKGQANVDEWTKWASLRLKVFEDRIKGNQFLVGDEFSVADILLSNAMRRTMESPLLKDFPALLAFRLKCEERPSWKTVLKRYEVRFKVPEGTADAQDYLQTHAH
ncbi:MAG: glutathione S-transferase family protein [Proteobacteria bacterium]|nr:MAG: glutathione S-transferase family protein [Pseudomonadota bacterium]